MATTKKTKRSSGKPAAKKSAGKRTSHADAVSAGMLKHATARKKARAARFAAKKRGNKPYIAKHIIFDSCLAALNRGDVPDADSLVEQFKNELSANVVRRWVSRWFNGNHPVPTIGDRDTAAELKAACAVYDRKNK